MDGSMSAPDEADQQILSNLEAGLDGFQNVLAGPGKAN